MESELSPQRRRARVALLVGLLLLVADLSRPPREQWSARAELVAIGWYRQTLSHRLGAAGVRCRFEPSCSRFAELAVRRDGALLGTARSAWRLVRCGPWTPAGSADPP